MPAHLNTHNEKPKSNKITPIMNKRLSDHRANHIKNGNDRNTVNSHMALMRREMRAGKSFNVSHKIAQAKFVMK